jgi:hypothetical protein
MGSGRLIPLSLLSSFSMSSILAGIEIPNLSKRSLAFWMGVSAGIQILVLSIPLFVRASQLEAKVDGLGRSGSDAHQAHVREAREADAVQDSRLSALEKAEQIRGAQLDEIQRDVKELLRRSPR